MSNKTTRKNLLQTTKNKTVISTSKEYLMKQTQKISCNNGEKLFQYTTKAISTSKKHLMQRQKKYGATMKKCHCKNIPNHLLQH